MLLVGGDRLLRAAIGDVIERAAFPRFGLTRQVATGGRPPLLGLASR
jgi:hypothetical protein